jgi:hypothetical protein
MSPSSHMLYGVIPHKGHDKEMEHANSGKTRNSRKRGENSPEMLRLAPCNTN